METHKEKDDWKLYKYLMNKGLFCTLVVIISFHSYLLEMKSFIVWKFSESSLLSFCKIMCFESKFLDIKQNIWLDLLGNRLEENNLVVFRIPFYLTTRYFDLCPVIRSNIKATLLWVNEKFQPFYLAFHYFDLISD